jgi:hypothetical protein
MKASVRSRRVRVVFGCLLAWAATGAWTAQPSSASTGTARYVYEVCDSALPGGNTPGVKFVGDSNFVEGTNTCAQPTGALGLVLRKQSHASPINYWSVPVDPPAGGSIDSITLSAWSCGAGATSKIFVYEPGWPVNCAGESQRTFHFTQQSPFHGLTVNLSCEETCANDSFVYAHYLAATEVDPVAPKIGAIQGSLLSRGATRGRESLSVETTDQGGGVSEIEVLVNGQPARQPEKPRCNVAQVVNPSVSGTVAVSAPPCPTTVKSDWTLDTAAYPFQEDVNTVRVCASDFASLGAPNSSCSVTQGIDVDNSCTESAVGGGETLTAKFAGSQDGEITVPFAQPAKVNGELADKEGDAIRGATICVQLKTLGSREDLRPVTTATTDAHGHFSYKVPAGPNRAVFLGYRHDTFQVARSMRYFAHAKPTLRLDPREVSSGGRIHISGKAPGPNAAGCVEILQASALHSRRWYTFDRATTNRRGVFHSIYRFDATTRTTTYRIRAVTPRQSGYPWAVGHSHPALVKVRVGR